MQKTHLAIVLFIVNIGFSGCVIHSGYYSPPKGKVQTLPPPKPIAERPFYPPFDNAVWIPGHWQATNSGYHWVYGYYVEPKEGQYWVSGGWVVVTGGYVFVPGYWWWWSYGYPPYRGYRYLYPKVRSARYRRITKTDYGRWNYKRRRSYQTAPLPRTGHLRSTKSVFLKKK